jgi:4-amino-4-deoxy-L-arabinose transferase-like glycosyltransferase
MKKKTKLLVNAVLLLVFVTAFVTRVWGIGNHPVGFNQDEAALGYDAYSLLKTGKDQWGVSWPLVLRSFGDFKLPLYSYLAIPSIAAFGLNEYATRFPSAILGFFAVVVTYLMVLEMTKNDKLAVLSSLFLAISPWHISLSRGAFEANLTAFFMTVGVWTFLKGLKNKKWLCLSSVFLGLNLFSYHSARLVTPLIYALLILAFYASKWEIKSIPKFIKEYKFSFIIFATFLVLAMATMFLGGGKRGADILITNPTDKWESVSNRRYLAVLQGLPDSYSRIFSNKATYTFKLFYSNYLSYLSPNFIFSQGAGEWNYGMIPGRGVLYSFEVLSVLCGLIFLIKGKSFKGLGFIIFWILIAPIPAALTKGPGYAANRAAVIIPAIQIFSAYGVLYLYLSISKVIQSKYVGTAYFSLLAFAIIVSGAFFFEDYIYHQPVHAASSMQVANREIVSKTLEIESGYREIRVSRTLSVPQIWIAFDSRWDPVDYQVKTQDWLEYERKGHLYIDQFDGYRLDKYRFGDLNWDANKNEDNVLFVGKPEEFPQDVEVLLTSNHPDGFIAFQVVESKVQK